MKSEIKKKAVHRLKIIHGQVQGLLHALEREDYCIDLLTQSLAIQKSLKSVNGLFLENHLRTHVKEQMRSKEEERAVNELVHIYNLKDK